MVRPQWLLRSCHMDTVLCQCQELCLVVEISEWNASPARLCRSARAGTLREGARGCVGRLARGRVAVDG